MTTHQLTLPALQHLLWQNVATNCCLIYLIHQILHPQTSILFPLLKEHLRGRWYESDDDVIQSVEYFLHEQDKTVLSDWYPEAAETMD